MLKANLRNQVRQTVLPKWRPLLPLFEAVMNAIQAIQEAPQRAHKISIEILRETELELDDLPSISGFIITDTGVGFNDANFDSFNTAFSGHKEARGGKGLGRFIWLKAFEKVEIVSVFHEKKEGFIHRKFIFDKNYDPDNAPSRVGPSANLGTQVKLIGFQSPYKQECPRTPDQIAQRLVEHFLLVLLHENSPIMELIDGSIRIDLLELFRRDYRSTAQMHEFDLKGRKFSMTGFRLYSQRAARHRLMYAGHDRAVISEPLDKFVPNLTGRLSDGSGGSFAYLAVVQGDYLNDRVNHGRFDFDLSDADDSEAEQGGLLSAVEISRTDIREQCLTLIMGDLAGIITSINEQKEKRILHYVHTEAPHYKILMKYLKDFINLIPPHATSSELELALHQELHKRELRLKQEGSKIIKEAEKLQDYEEYHRRFSAFMENYNELGISALAQHVMHRKIILDFLENAISQIPGKTQYPMEKAVHNVIFPMKEDSDSIPAYQHNLWIIDETLTYQTYVSSDKPLSTIDRLNNEADQRPDLFLFDRRMLFSDGPTPLNSITVVEFKRPMRDDYKPQDNPTSQAFTMIEKIRSGEFRNERGRVVGPATDGVPAFCYIICDITDSLKKIMVDIPGSQIMPDKLEYYGYHPHREIYYHVIDYTKLLNQAKKRNRVFFDKLNILGNP